MLSDGRQMGSIAFKCEAPQAADFQCFDIATQGVGGIWLERRSCIRPDHLTACSLVGAGCTLHHGQFGSFQGNSTSPIALALITGVRRCVPVCSLHQPWQPLLLQPSRHLSVLLPGCASENLPHCFRLWWHTSCTQGMLLDAGWWQAGWVYCFPSYARCSSHAGAQFPPTRLVS